MMTASPSEADAAMIPHNDPFFSRIEALIIPTTSATLSVISSLLIILIILRSQSRLSSSYHIIIFFMSFWDIIFSISIAFTTIPMPTEILDIFPFPGGLVYGNKRTCEAQGFLMLFSASLTLWSNAILNLYYVSTIRYGISDIVMRTRYLPTVLATVFLISLPVPIMLLHLNYFKPHIYAMNCFIGSEPLSPLITEKDKNDYKRGNGITRVYKGISIGGIFIIIVSSMALIVTRIYEKKSLTSKAQNESMGVAGDAEICDGIIIRNENDDSRDDEDEDEDEIKESSYNPNKEIMRQAFMYIGAFSLSWFPLLIKNGIAPTSIPIHVIQSLLTPLQGSFNAMIFIYHKAHILRRSDIGEYSILEAIKVVIVSPELVPEMLMDLSQLDSINIEDVFMRGQKMLRNGTEKSVINRKGSEIQSHKSEYDGMNNKPYHSDDSNACLCSYSISNMISTNENTNENNEYIENESQISHSLQSQALSGFYNSSLSIIDEVSENVGDLSI